MSVTQSIKNVFQSIKIVFTFRHNLCSAARLLLRPELRCHTGVSKQKDEPTFSNILTLTSRGLKLVFQTIGSLYTTYQLKYIRSILSFSDPSLTWNIVQTLITSFQMSHTQNIYISLNISHKHHKECSLCDRQSERNKQNKMYVLMLN